MTRILLTTVMKPFGIDSDDCTVRTQPELFHSQITFAQGIFSLRAFYGAFGLEYIALNIKPETVVLNYPSESEFVKELKKGYDYVGISYVMCTHEKMRKMVALIRKHAPNSKVILGGYGTTIPDSKELGDYVCREEGVNFMRKLLGEDLNAPRDHPIIKEAKKILGYPIDKGSILLAGLGCPNGCDFCCTSHFYDRKHLSLLPTGKDIYDVLMKIDKKIHTRLVGIMEEDFLLYKKRVLELAEYTRAETERPFRMLGFSSIRSIKNYDPVFLAEMGIETLWIGIESKSSQDLREQHKNIKYDANGNEIDISSYSKMDNVDIKKVIDDLHNVGINTLISMIIGLEHHTPENIKSDLDFHMSLEPGMSQFMIYTAIPGTPLYDCLNKEGRILEIPWHKVDGFLSNFKHQHMTQEQISEMQNYCFKTEYETLGPSVFRFVKNSYKGYLRFRDSEIPIQQARARVFERYCRQSLPLFEVGIQYAPNDKVRGMILELQEKFNETFGGMNNGQKILSRLAKISAKVNQKMLDRGEWILQPRLERKVYDVKSKKFLFN